jgi:hypothetical protein
MTSSSRIDSARRRLQVTRYAVGIAAAGVFAGGVAVARAAHPGSGHHSTSVQAAIPSESDSVAAAAQSSGLGAASGDSSGSSISPAPSTSPPVVQSSGS